MECIVVFIQHYWAWNFLLILELKSIHICVKGVPGIIIYERLHYLQRVAKSHEYYGWQGTIFRWQK